MIGDQHTFVAVLPQNAQHADHVGVALVHECLVIVGHLAADVAEVNIGNPPGAAVAIDHLVDIGVWDF